MNIVALTHFYIEDNRAGGELMLHGLLSALAARGHRVTALITDTHRPNTIIDDVSVIYGVDPNTVLNTYPYDVVISQFSNTIYAKNNARRMGKPHVHIVHNDSPITLRRASALQRGDLNVFNTHWIAEKSKSSAQRLVVHPKIDPKTQIMGAQGDHVTLVNLTVDKGAETFYGLAQAFPEVKFLGVLGGYYKDKQVVVDLPNVTIIDNTANMGADVYAKSRVVLVPSHYETYGMVASEAAANGIPVIASPTPGLLENLGDAGIFVERDLTQWGRVLTRLLRDPDYYQDVSIRCRSRQYALESETEMLSFIAAVEALPRRR